MFGCHALSLAAAATMVLTTAPAAAGADLQTGRWLHATRLSPDGTYWLPPTEREGCLTPAQAAAPDAEVRRQLAAVGCNADSLQIRDGRIAAQLACQGSARVSVSGRYDARGYRVEFRTDRPLDLGALGGIPGLALQVVGQATGRHLGPC